MGDSFNSVSPPSKNWVMPLNYKVIGRLNEYISNANQTILDLPILPTKMGLPLIGGKCIYQMQVILSPNQELSKTDGSRSS